MKNWKKLFSIAMMVLVLGACGSSSSSHGSYATSSETYYDNDAYEPAMAAEGLAYGGDFATESMKEEENGTDASAVTGQKLVYTGSLTIETLGYEETVRSVRDYISQYKGIIQDQNENDGDTSWYYTDGRGRMTNRSISMTVRIPTGSFDSFMTDMEGTGKITSRNQNVENISRRYSDNSIEIEALEKQQERLLEMMDKAQSVDEMIMVEERLSEVQTELNQKKSYQSSMDTDVEYSTIYINIREVQQYTPVTDPGINISGFWQRLKDTAEYSAKYFVYVLQNLVLGVVRILPFALVVLLVVLIIKQYRKAKGLDTKLFHRKPKEERNWKEYMEERKAQLNAKNEAEKIDAELKKKDQGQS